MEQQITLLEKYFPKDFEHLLLPSRIKNTILATQQKIGYRLLMYSSPGTGKTTTSRLLCSGGDYEAMYLSGSNNFNVDLMRTKVMPFSSGFSVLGKKKVLIIDEAENIKNDLQDSFKIILDQCTSVNYIFITNEVEKINPAIRSRCTNLDYDFSGADLDEQKQNYVNFILEVCKKESIKYDKDGIRALFRLTFPDFRTLLIKLQLIVDIKEPITLENVKKFAESGKQNLELYNIVETPSINGKEFYTEMTKFKGKERDCFLSLGEPFFLYLNEKELFERTLETAIIVSKYSDSFVNSINKFVTLMSCIVELKSLFR